MKLWIARDEDNSLFLYDEKPIKRKCMFTLKWFSHAFKIKSQHFPEVTFENSPKEVEIKISGETRHKTMNKNLLKLGFPKIRKANYPYWIYKVGFGDGHYWILCNDLISAIKYWFRLIFNLK